MRVFWSLIFALILGAIAAAGWSYTRASRVQDEARAARVAAENSLAQAQAAEAQAQREQEEAQRKAIEAKKVSEASPPTGTSEQKSASVFDAAKKANEPRIAATTIPSPKSASHTPVTPQPPQNVAPREEPKDAPGSSADGIPAKIGEYDVRPVKIKKNDDGSITLDERFTIKGDGTKGDPYRVPWELLLSCKDTFEPAAGLKKIPGRIAFLNDKFVRLDGYVAFPLMMQKPTELLSMLNQWDGCCIGVPPTPYDAVEAKLSKVVTGDDRFATTGVVIGKFKVDPYVVKNPKGDWLISMYTLSASEFTSGDIGPGGAQ